MSSTNSSSSATRPCRMAMSSAARPAESLTVVLAPLGGADGVQRVHGVQKVVVKSKHSP
jgi:hypothetical protein